MGSLAARAQVHSVNYYALLFSYKLMNKVLLFMPPGSSVQVHELRSLLLPPYGRPPQSSLIRSAAFSATMMVGAFVLPLGTVGNTEASTTLRPCRGGRVLVSEEATRYKL